MTRFLCVGDLHLGAGAGYGREPGDRLRDQEAVWARALALAAEHGVDAVLFAGDAFHYRRPSPAELLAFQRPLQEFTDTYYEIPVVVIAGNHDVESASAPNVLELFGDDDHVEVFSQPGVYADAGRCQVACLPWSPVSRLVAARDGGDRDTLHAEAAELLLATARGLRERIDGPAVLLLHWSISGASTPLGVMADDFREVVLPAPELEALGFDAVVAGHIHKPQRLDAPHEVTDGGPFELPVFYVGSPAPVDFGESASEHGAWLLDVDPHRVSPVATFLPIESRPFVTLDYDVTDPTDIQVPAVRDVTDAVVRLRYRATEDVARHIDQGAIRRALYNEGAHKVYAIQPTIIRAERARVEGVTEELAPLAAVDAWVAANEVGPDEHKRLAGVTREYLEAVQ